MSPAAPSTPNTGKEWLGRPRCKHRNVLWRAWTVLPLRAHEDGIVWCRDCKRMVKVKR